MLKDCVKNKNIENNPKITQNIVDHVMEVLIDLCKRSYFFAHSYILRLAGSL